MTPAEAEELTAAIARALERSGEPLTIDRDRVDEWQFHMTLLYASELSRQRQMIRNLWIAVVALAISGILVAL